MDEWQAYERGMRRRERRDRIVGALLMLISAAFMVMVGWFAIIGMVVVFG